MDLSSCFQLEVGGRHVAQYTQANAGTLLKSESGVWQAAHAPAQIGLNTVSASVGCPTA